MTCCTHALSLQPQRRSCRACTSSNPDPLGASCAACRHASLHSRYRQAACPCLLPASIDDVVCTKPRSCDCLEGHTVHPRPCKTASGTDAIAQVSLPKLMHLPASSTHDRPYPWWATEAASVNSLLMSKVQQNHNLHLEARYHCPLDDQGGTHWT